MSIRDKYVTIDSLNKQVGQCVTIAGWVRHHRSPGKIIFIVLRDGTGLVQAVLEKKDADEGLFAKLKNIGLESALEITGMVREDQRAPGGVELTITDAKIIHSSVDYPITPKHHGIDFLMKHRHLWLRSPKQAAIMKIRDTLVFAIREFFHNRQFVLVDTPIFSPSAGEGASTLFKVDHFGQDVYLAQTGQLYLESAAMALRNVYCFGPTFRAEKSKTRRHLTEFWMVEPELAFADLDDLMRLAEDFICYIVGKVLENNRRELELLDRDIAKLKNIVKPFVRLSYDDVVDILHSDRAKDLLENEANRIREEINNLQNQLKELESQEMQAKKSWQKEKIRARIIEIREKLPELNEQLSNIPKHIELAKNFRWGKDLGGSDETIISKLYDRPVFVTHYPREAKAFYMRQDRARPKVVENFDLLAPEGVGEIIGGSVREEELDRLIERMKEENMPIEPYQWYLDIRRYGSVPHGGFGLGIERTLGWICGLKHIREAIAFPRMMGKVYP